MRAAKIFFCFCALTSSVSASTITISPIGINSLGLRDAQGDLLTGAGISIGQVEPHRPGDQGAGDLPNFRNSTINPEAVFYRNTAPIPNDPASVQNHASWIAGILISTNTNQYRGIAPEAKLYSSAYDPQAGGPQPLTDTQATLSAQHITEQNGGDVRVINLSFQNPVVPAATVLDGNQLLTQFIDWSASTDNVLYVASGKNTTSPAGFSIPSDNFNGITVAASEINNGVYRKVATINDFSEPVSGERTTVSILAPGRNVEVFGLGDIGTIQTGRSFAAPHVTGTVALLQEYGDERIAANAPNWTGTVASGPTARRHEVMKAVLMNSADKLEDDGTFAPVGSLLGMDRTVLDQNGDHWLVSEANDNSVLTGSGDIPLDDQMGAGHLNAKRALQQFLPGEFDSDGADVPSIGWDYGMTSGQGDTNVYRLSETLQAGSYISITLAWDREVEFANDADGDGAYDIGDTFQEYTETDPYADDVISDLDLKLFGPSFLEAQSISFEGTLEHIFFEIPATGQYRFEVEQFDADAGPQNYGLAWWYGLAPEIEPPELSGDFDGDNDVDGADFLAWQRDMNLGSLSDWESDFGSSTGTFAAAVVPEPTAWLLFAIGLASGCPRSLRDKKVA